ncbi:zinc finger protein 391-like isoform X4 [Agrilus planipennis]|uniref:Zinc finger protein 391-like isoform X3 n=1 Tax=Agrilus planipennis TaxID=224129 RepID=A0A1W4X773_AGRPL|nr:zinc finger protein 391-like isoform X3 [Agrilus planipennis]XP_025837720.1 zinc finger protein 391-like isoform X4 [Agrilus planipennis]
MNNLLIKNIQLTKTCRTCLQSSDEMFSLFTKIENNLEKSMYIYECIMSISCMKILPNDGLPSMICTTCLELAHTAFKFQQQCNRSYEILEYYSAEIQSNLCDKKPSNWVNTLDYRNTEQPSEIACVSSNELFIETIKEEDFKVIDKCHVDTVIEADEDQNSKGLELINSQKKSVRPKGRRIERITCNQCGKQFKHISTLKVHMSIHSQDRPHVCQTCGKSFKQHGSLLYHLRSHTGEQPYVCNICGKKYKQSGTLTAHMRIHTGQKPYLCSVCGRGFRQAPDLSYHMRTHTKERPYMCNVCGKTMRMQCHLVQHMRTHTGEKPFKCTQCDKAFPSSTRLKRHTVVHTGLKPYTCDVCHKSFNRSSTLNTHAKIHTDERPHLCSVCNKGFIQAHALRAHLLTHKTTDPPEELPSKLLVFVMD